MSMDDRVETSENASKKRSLLEKFREEFEKAELAIKEGELSFRDSADGECSATLQGLFMPAINELRYAGRHLSAFVLSDETLDDLYEAISHCVRARHDAYDCLIQYCLRDIRTFQEQYRSLVIGDVTGDYAECKQRINEVKTKSRKIGRRR